MNCFFKKGYFDQNIFPKVLYPCVIEEIEESIALYNHIKHYQDSNKDAYEKYMPLLHQLDYIMLRFLVSAGIKPEDGMYLKVDEKISKIQEWLNCLKEKTNS